MKKIKLLLVLAGVAALTSCKGFVSITKENLSKADNLPERYVENMFVSARIGSRAASETDFMDEFFKDELIEDEEGNKICFADLSETEKSDFAEYWKKECVLQLQEKLEKDEALTEVVELENAAFEETVETMDRSVLPCTVETFGKKFFENMQRRMTIVDSSRAAKPKTADNLPMLSEDYNIETMGILKQVYKKGRMLICKDTSSSSASSYIGHSSMMKDEKLEDSIYDNPMYKSMVTSYPIEKNMNWPEKRDGVQYEPTVYWVSTQLGANKVTVVEARLKKTVIGSNGKKTTVYEQPSEQDVEKTVAYAALQEKLEKPYDWQLLWKYDTTEFYCSSLLWRAWYETNNAYSFNSAPWITPAAIASSDKTRFIVEYNNR